MLPPSAATDFDTLAYFATRLDSSASQSVADFAAAAVVASFDGHAAFEHAEFASLAVVAVEPACSDSYPYSFH